MINEFRRLRRREAAAAAGTRCFTRTCTTSWHLAFFCSSHVGGTRFAQYPYICSWDGDISSEQLECGPMPNVMAALPNIGGALRLTPQSLADAHY